MSLQTNPQLELAFDLVRSTHQHVFLTGKAGSGKTTFLHQIRSEGLKRMTVVAPTGVAAINAGGMTIHSMFQIPLGLHLAGVQRNASAQPRRFRAEKIRLIRSLDLLVIDEISMVRADLLDAVDEVLRRYRHSDQPFGDVQLLMIGDLNQLPPVVKPEDWELLKQHYQTAWFFGSHALKQANYVSIELQHVYRQSDEEFIGLLNQVRDNRLDGTAFRKLNSRLNPNFFPPAEQPYITLTATNVAASAINRQNLDRLPGECHSFRATVVGEFQPGSFPTEEVLEFRVGAQVMFIRNDTSPAKRYFNGRIGRITAIDDDGISVTCPEDSQTILVEPAEWKNLKYVLNEETKQIEEQVVGTFTQYPLRLAWAITIHKSQGLTFDRCIIDAQAAFATGQVYVALSRCRSFEGIVLRSPIEPSSVRTDPVVRQFNAEAEQKYPTASQVQQAKREYQSATARELFGFDAVARALRKLVFLCREHSQTVLPETQEQCKLLEARAENELFRVATTFAPQLERYLNQECLPETNEPLQVRVRKASLYFTEKLTGLAQDARQLSPVTDNKDVTTQFKKCIESLQLTVAVKSACFAACQNGFSCERVSHAKVNAELDFSKHVSQPETGAVRVPKGIPNADLYRQLWQWREEVAQRDGVPAFGVVRNLTLKELVVYLPTEKGALGDVPGIGRTRLQRYGDDMIAIIRQYRQEHNVDAPPVPRPCVLPDKTSGASLTMRISLELFRTGRSISEIAAQRGFAPSTIAGHLAHFIRSGELDIALLMERGKVEEIQQYLLAHPESTMSEVKAHFGDQYDYIDLKLVMAHANRDHSGST